MSPCWSSEVRRRYSLQTCLPEAEAHLGLTKAPSAFGGITRGVIEAASMGGKRRAPVMRLEELHQVCPRHSHIPLSASSFLHSPVPSFGVHDLVQ